MTQTKEKKTVYVLHKNGANNHYIGLKTLLEKEHGKIVFREFSILSTLFKSLLKLNFALFGKQLVNAFFLLKLFFSKDKKVVLGIAPYDYKLRNILVFLKNHSIYYHTSWTCWDETFYPKKKKVTPDLKAFWKDFIENKTQHIFAVSQKTKEGLLQNYKLSDSKISVVYHSLNAQYFNEKASRQKAGEKLKFVYAGRFRSEKGLDEVLDFFVKNPDKELTLAGSGELKPKIVEFSDTYPNIHFVGQINEAQKLAQLFGESHYLILNSKKTAKWEELFGMVLIEAMACGCIPIATHHTGPKEVIDSGQNGFLIEEGKLTEFLNGLNSENYSTEMQQKAIQKGKEFTKSTIAKRWEAVLTD